MAEDFVQLPVNGAGEKLRTEKLTIGLNDVHQEVVTIAGQTGNEMEVDATGNAQVDIAEVSTVVPVNDNGGSLTVDGTVTADTELPAASALADNDANPTTSRIGANQLLWDGATWDRAPGNSTDGMLVNLGANNDVTITGTVTITEPVSVDDNGGSLTVDNPTLSVVGGGTEATALRVTVANDSTGLLSVDDNGGSLTVDGTVAVSSITTSVTPGTAAANLGKAEDAPHTTGDVGVMALAVRNDAGATIAADGDYIPFSTDAAGNLRVTGGTGVTQYAEDTPHVTGDTLTLAGVVRQDADAPLSADGDRSLLQVDALGHLKVDIKSGTVTVAEPVSVDDNGGSLTIDNPTLSVVGGGTEATALRVTLANDSTGLVSVDDNGGSLTVDAVNLDIRDLTHVSDSVRIGDGTLTATVRDTGASDSLNVAIVDAAGNQVTSFGGGGTQYAEDTVAGAGDIGTVALAKRQDTPAADVDTDGDRARLTVDAVNRLWTNGSSVTQPISAAALPLPAGAATSALQLPNSHDVTVDNGAGVAAVNIQDGGNVITVDGTVAVSSITTSVTPGTAAANLGKAEDAQHASGDVGVMALGVRTDSGTTFTSIDGDYSPLSIDAQGALRVSTVGGTAFAEDTPHNDGDLLTLAGVIQQAADAALSDDGDRSLMQVDATGWLKAAIKASVLPTGAATAAGQLPNSHDVTVDNAGGGAAVNIQDGGNSITVDGTVTVTEPVSVDDNGGSLTIDGSVAVTQVTPGTGATDLGKAEDTAHTTGDVGVMPLAVRNDAGTALAADGDYIPLSTNSSGALRVTGGTAGTEFAEDTAHVTGALGTLALAVRNDAAAALTTTDGDYSVLATDSAGRIGISDLGGSITVDGTVSVAEPVSVDDNGASLTVDNPTLSVVGGGTEATALRVTVANDSTGVLSIDDNGGSITVDGTVTVTEPVSVDDNGGSLTVDNPTLSVVGGGAEATALRVTLANDSTGLVSVDDNGASLTVDGTVAVSSVIPGTGSTNLGKLEDAPHASGDVGVMMLAVRNDSNIALASTDLDYIPLAADSAGNLQVTVAGGILQYAEDSAHIDGDGLTLAGVVQQAADAALSGDGDRSLLQVDATGFAKVNVKTSALPAGAATSALQLPNSHDVTVDNGASGAAVNIQDGGNVITVDGTVAVSSITTSVTPGTAATNLGKAEDAAHASGDVGIMALGVRNDAGATTYGADQDYTPIATDANGRVGIADLGGTITVDGTVAVSSITTSVTPGTAATNLGKAEDAVHASNDVGVMALAVSNEANIARAADSDYIPIATDTEGNVRMVGNRDHDAADAGEPVKVGGVAVSGSATPTSVASGDRTRFIANQHGIPYHIAGHPNLITREYDFGASAQTDVNLASAVVAADERVYVTRFEALNDIATTAAGVSVRAGFGTANVPTASASGVSGMIGTHPGLAPGSGIMSGTGAGVIAVGGAGEEPRLTSSAATAGNLHVLISYFLIDETP